MLYQSLRHTFLQTTMFQTLKLNKLQIVFLKYIKRDCSSRSFRMSVISMKMCVRVDLKLDPEARAFASS